MAKNKKVIRGPVMVTVEPEPVPEQETINIPEPEEVSTDSVDVSETTELYPTVEDEAIKQADTTYKPYTPGNTAQHKIPLKYKLWGAIATAIAAILGIWIACSHTELPVSILPLSVECDADAGTALVTVEDKEHIRVDVFRDNCIRVYLYTRWYTLLWLKAWIIYVSCIRGTAQLCKVWCFVWYFARPYTKTARTVLYSYYC